MKAELSQVAHDVLVSLNAQPDYCSASELSKVVGHSVRCVAPILTSLQKRGLACKKETPDGVKWRSSAKGKKTK